MQMLLFDMANGHSGASSVVNPRLVVRSTTASPSGP
jgi:hypothetical protein